MMIVIIIIGKGSLRASGGGIANNERLSIGISIALEETLLYVSFLLN